MLSLDKLYTTNKEVAEIVVSIPPHKATGDDGISAKAIKDCGNYFYIKLFA